MKYSINLELNKPNSNNESSILFRLRVNNNRITISSGIIIPIKFWDSSKKSVNKSFKNAIVINSNLNNYKSEIETIILQSDFSGVEITKDLFIEKLSFTKQVEKKDEMESYFSEFLQVKSVSVDKFTLGRYKMMYNAIKLVAKLNNINFAFENFNDSFYAMILNYLYKEKGLKSNGACNYIKNFKVYLTWCFDKGYNKNMSYQKYKVPKHETEIFPLYENEIRILESYKGSQSKERVRDIFLFQTYTGLRFGDAMNILREQVKGDNLILLTQKTKQKLLIPITKKSRVLIDKYKEADTNGYIFPQITNQKANGILKSLAKEAGLDREIIYHEHFGLRVEKRIEKLYDNISTHDARRTFITYSLTKGMNAQMIMAITGHKNYSTFERYVSFDEKDISKILNTIWNE